MPHTPGPWSLARIIGFPTSLGVGIDGSPAIAILTLDAHKNEEHQKANAHLIAEAPNLLGACKQILPTLSGKWYDFINKAIERAEAS